EKGSEECGDRQESSGEAARGAEESPPRETERGGVQPRRLANPMGDPLLIARGRRRQVLLVGDDLRGQRGPPTVQEVSLPLALPAEPVHREDGIALEVTALERFDYHGAPEAWHGRPADPRRPADRRHRRACPRRRRQRERRP